MTLTPGNKQTNSESLLSGGCMVYTKNTKEITPTISFLGVIEQDAVDWGSNQNSATCLLNDGDHVVGDFTGSALRVPGTVQVVSDQQAVH